MGVVIKKITLQNYKLFAYKEIIFTNYLSVFDGPNGYGKTSVFDAIELLITGDISRITNNSSISGTVGYGSNFLAQNSSKSVIIKGAFENASTNEQIFIGIVLRPSEGTSKKNNPKYIKEQIEYYLLPNYDYPFDSWHEFYITQDEMDKKRQGFFGSQNIKFFTLLHYIHQEDRLLYFKQSEADRTSAIENLFGITKDIERKEKLDKAQKTLNSRIKQLDTRIQKLKLEVDSIPSFNDEIVYEPILGGQPMWDKENLGFLGLKSKDLYEELKTQIEAVRMFCLYKDYYHLIKSYLDFQTLDETKQCYGLLVSLLLKQNNQDFDDLKQNVDNYRFCVSQKQLFDDGAYSQIQWEKLCGFLECQDIVPLIIDYLKQYKLLTQNQNELEKTIARFFKSRTALMKDANSISLLSKSNCPYCGQDWKSQNELQAQVEETGEILKQVLHRENNMIVDVCEKIQKEFSNVAYQILQTKISDYENNAIIHYALIFEDLNALKLVLDKALSLLEYSKRSDCDVSAYADLENEEQAIAWIRSTIVEVEKSIDSKAVEMFKKHAFESIYKKYFDGNNYLDTLSETKIKSKLQYLEASYYNSFKNARSELELLGNQREKLSQIYREMKEYFDILKKSIQEYQQIVIKQMEIPFFLYCSRLLQSYQGGQGVVIKSDGKNIRFTAPNQEHDVLYTMSSGQLSAVLLAFSLALNKIYSGDIFNLVLIDDPIQCMDDINMISFVELLRIEFNKTQVILSTHEDEFSNFIRYKFDNYNLSEQAITLKEI